MGEPNQSPTYLQDFGDEILVVCPQCRECALLVRFERESVNWGNRLVCHHCGHSRDWRVRRRDRVVFPGSGPHLVYGLETWLQVRCWGEVLWAFNREHLEFLRSFVSSDLRKRPRVPNHGWANRSLESRLPRWIKAAKNREIVLRKLDELERQLPEAYRRPVAESDGKRGSA